MNWQHSIEHLHIDTYISHLGTTVVRTGRNRYIVLIDGFAFTIGGGTTSEGMAIARCIEIITDTPQPHPCAKCGKPREISCYCREHYNAVHLEINRKHRQKTLNESA